MGGVPRPSGRWIHPGRVCGRSPGGGASAGQGKGEPGPPKRGRGRGGRGGSRAAAPAPTDPPPLTQDGARAASRDRGLAPPPVKKQRRRFSPKTALISPKIAFISPKIALISPQIFFISPKSPPPPLPPRSAAPSVPRPRPGLRKKNGVRAGGKRTGRESRSSRRVSGGSRGGSRSGGVGSGRCEFVLRADRRI